MTKLPAERESLHCLLTGRFDLLDLLAVLIDGGKVKALFHDLRRAFATMSADELMPDALQALMRHKSYTTAQKYINMARHMDAAVASLHGLKAGGAGRAH